MFKIFKHAVEWYCEHTAPAFTTESGREAQKN